MTETKIVKNGPGDYVAKCLVPGCGWRQEMKASLVKTKAATKEHAQTHEDGEEE